MKLKAYRRIGDPEPIVKEVGVVVVEDDNGNPIAVACDGGNGLIYAATAEDPNFNRFLHSMGIDKLTIVRKMDNPLENPDPRHMPKADPFNLKFGA